MKLNKDKIKQHSRNLNITTRVSLSAVFGIVIPVIIAAVFSSIFLNSLTSYFNFSSVTTNSYSMLNQIQWNQTLASISNELVSDDSQEIKYKKINDYVSPLEEYNTEIYIECEDKPFYSTSDKEKTLSLLSSIIDVNLEQNTDYFGENGMVIVSHINGKSEEYTLIIVNKDYTVNDVSSTSRAQSYSSLVFSKTGLALLFIIVLFILSIALLSLITSKAISRPINKLAEGANEIAEGNLDYVIDYESTNEIGQTVKAFNDMTSRLKRSIDRQNSIEQSRKEMIAGVAHDLRTPLTSVKGYVEGLRDGIASTPEMQERYLDTIYSSTLSMEHMLDDLLTISRLELGRIELNTELINLNDFLDECNDELSFELEKQGVEFSYKNDCTEPIYTELDAERFIRVIKNIISNSVKYAKKDVPLKIEMSVQSYQRSAIISISDNGIGLDSESLRRIFETFYRADKARSKVSEGSGIGLAVCKQIVELHGGHIWATSTEGEGLTVLISLERKDTKGKKIYG